MMSKMSGVLFVAMVVWSATMFVRSAPQDPETHEAERREGHDKSESTGELELRYARTWLALTEAELDRVRETNQRVAGAYPGAVVAEHEKMVEAAKAQLEARQSDERGVAYDAFLLDAKAAWAKARGERRQAEAINEHTPGSFGKTTMKILALRVELARLLLEQGQAADVASRESQVDWQLRQLRHEVIRLREEVGKNQSGRYIRRYRYID